MRKTDISWAFKAMAPFLDRPSVPPSLFRSIAAQVPQKRDKHTFYWREYPRTLTDKWSFECEEFRHKVEPETFQMRLQVPKDGMIEHFVVRCRVTGSNLPDPFGKTAEITIKWERKNAIEALTDILSKAYGHDFDFDAADDETEE